MWIQLIIKAWLNCLCHLKECLTNEPVTKGVVLSKVLTVDVALFGAHHEQGGLLLLLNLGRGQRRRVFDSMNEFVPVCVLQGKVLKIILGNLSMPVVPCLVKVDKALGSVFADGVVAALGLHL